MRTLHLIHSFELVVSSMQQGHPRRSFRPFLFKFSLFLVLNGLKLFLGLGQDYLTVDETVMNDFVWIYFLTGILWPYRPLQNLIHVVRGHVILRTFYFLLFTRYRIHAFFTCLQLFEGDKISLAISLLTLFEFGTFLSLKLDKASFIQTLLVVTMVLTDKEMWIYPVGLLIYRHWFKKVFIS